MSHTDRGAAASSGWVAGVDGCRAGWVAVLHHATSGALVTRVAPDFPAVLDFPERPDVIAVDVPIGLLAVARRGGRDCEITARKILGRRASSVFSSPTRSALAAYRADPLDYRAVVTANRGGIATAPGTSKQSFAILPKISEVDAILVAGVATTVVEVHPELCLAEANRGVPMAFSKKRKEGRAERESLLEALGFATAIPVSGRGLPAGVANDDLLDACIACWTASRVANGTAIRTPAVPPLDGQGLPMEMWR